MLKSYCLCFSVKGPELINMYVGQSEENVREGQSTPSAKNKEII